MSVVPETLTLQETDSPKRFDFTSPSLHGYSSLASVSGKLQPRSFYYLNFIMTMVSIRLSLNFTTPDRSEKLKFLILFRHWLLMT